MTDTTTSNRRARYLRACTGPDVRRAFVLVIASRLLLWGIGLTANYYLSPLTPKGQNCVKAKCAFSHVEALRFWGNWDTGYYLSIAHHLYPTTSAGRVGASYAFFPLYPLAIRALGTILGGSYFAAGLLISNLALVVTCVALERLVRLTGDVASAHRAVRYLLLFPSAFLLSAVLSESLFLALSVLTVYFARSRRPAAAAFSGILLCLTRSTGILIVAFLLLDYLRQREWSLRAVRLDVAWCLAPVLGTVAFMTYSAKHSHDALAFVHAEQGYWGHHGGSILSIVTEGFTSFGGGAYWLGALSVFVYAALLLVGIRLIDFPLWAYGVLVLFASVSIGVEALQSVVRYEVVIFPAVLVVAALARRPGFDRWAPPVLGGIQVLLLILWSQCWTHIIL